MHERAFAPPPSSPARAPGLQASPKPQSKHKTSFAADLILSPNRHGEISKPFGRLLAISLERALSSNGFDLK
jgi:hypothetical protein